jgi:hypothetical protein
MAETVPLKLVALDAEDLAVLSAHVQDAVLKVGDIIWRPRQRRLLIAANRFAWEASLAEGRSRSYQRRRAILHFDRVLAVRACRIRRDRPDAVLELLAIEFKPGTEPAGFVNLVFAGGGVIQLEVECIEARLTDLNVAWATRAMPAHDVSDIPAEAVPAGRQDG